MSDQGVTASRSDDEPAAQRRGREAPSVREAAEARTEASRLGFLRAASAEFVGACVFVFLAAGAAVVSNTLGGTELTTASRLLTISLAAGLGLGIVVAATARLSGAHINPVVTLTVLITGDIGPLTALAYVVAQLLGGALAAVLILLIVPGDNGAMGATLLASNVGVGSGILAEIVFTFVLVFVVYATALDPKGPKALAPFSIGVTVLVINLMGAPLTGASMNPARSFGPALVGGQWADHWLYWIGPLIGGLLALLTYRKLYWGRHE